MQAPSVCHLSTALFLPPPSAFPLPTRPRCINIYTPGLAGIFLQLLPWSLGELVLSLNSCSRSGCLGQTRAGPGLGACGPPGVEGAVGGRNSPLKKSQSCGKDPSSLLCRLPKWRPSKSCLIPAIAGEVGPASPGWGLLHSGLGFAREGWRIIPKQTGWC